MCSVCYKKKYFKPTKEDKEKDKPKITKSCTKGCGFFGDEKFGFMCSKCYMKENNLTVLPKEIKKVKTWRKHFNRALLKLKAVRVFAMKKPEQKEKNRCWKCRRRIGITGIECRCGYIFCGKHRYADEHDCDYDHKERQRKKLAKENKEVKTSKFEKINDDGDQ